MATTPKHDQRLRAERLGFRVDAQTKALIERAAPTRRTVVEHETLALSDRDRAVFFEALVERPA